MFQVLNEKEKALARSIDKENGIKNCWNFAWLDENIPISWRDQGKEKTVKNDDE